jgi:hypothetical protein
MRSEFDRPRRVAVNELLVRPARQRSLPNTGPGPFSAP